MVPQIEFSTNWNNKLGCNAFTTIRLFNPNKYIITNVYEIVLKSIPQFNAEIIDIKHFDITKLNHYMAYLDTGYSVDETVSIFKTMYSKVNFNNAVLSMILLKKVKI